MGEQLRTYRAIGATLHAIEDKLETLSVPDELEEAYELERLFVGSVRMDSERAAEVIQARDLGRWDRAEIETLASRANLVHDAIRDRVHELDPTSCALRSVPSI